MYGSPKKRTRKAYWAALVVFFRYRKLKWKSKLFGQEYYLNRLPELNEKNGIYIKDKILELQGLFIKVGQLLSVLSNVLPDSFRKPLEELQDQVPPIQKEELIRVLNEEIEGQAAEVFSNINYEPIATASIGQTHRAELATGEDVVIKIQHPEIEWVAELDLKIIKKLMYIGARNLRMKGIRESYQEIESMIREEIDYRNEARYMQLFAEKYEDQSIRVPKVYHQFTRRNLVLMSYEEGFKINDLQLLEKYEVDRTDLARRLLTCFAEQIFKEGLFHADPHPGNVLANAQGEIILLDFGAVGELTEKMREGIARFILATLNFDSEKMTEALIQMDFVVSDDEAKIMSKKIIDIGVDFLKNEVDIQGLNIDQIHFKSGHASLFKLLKKIDVRSLGDSFQVPKDWILLQRTAVLVLGICNELDPKFNPVDVLKPYLNEFLLGKKNGFRSMVQTFLKKQVYSLFQLPYELNRFLSNANKNSEPKMSLTARNIELMKHHSNQSRWMFFMAIGLTVFLVLESGRLEEIMYWILIVVASILLFLSFSQRKQARSYARKI